MGKREANKQATREALQQAADRLFAERGYEQTTVQDIAEAAGVTPRTFFRYFAGKEDLILDDALAWVPVLADAIRHRPAEEGPLTAFERAVAAVSRRLESDTRPTPTWLFTDGPPAGRLGARRGAGTMLRIEQTIADALRERVAERSDRSDYRCDVLARCGMAAMRSALIRDWQLRERGDTRRPSRQTLIRQAFEDLATAE